MGGGSAHTSPGYAPLVGEAALAAHPLPIVLRVRQGRVEVRRQQRGRLVRQVLLLLLLWRLHRRLDVGYCSCCCHRMDGWILRMRLRDWKSRPVAAPVPRPSSINACVGTEGCVIGGCFAVGIVWFGLNQWRAQEAASPNNGPNGRGRGMTSVSAMGCLSAVIRDASAARTTDSHLHGLSNVDRSAESW